MALKKCKKCGKDVKDTLAKCPHCGGSMLTSGKKKKVTNTKEQPKTIVKYKNETLNVVVFVILILYSLISIYNLYVDIKGLSQAIPILNEQMAALTAVTSDDRIYYAFNIIGFVNNIVFGLASCAMLWCLFFYVNYHKKALAIGGGVALAIGFVMYIVYTIFYALYATAGDSTTSVPILDLLSFIISNFGTLSSLYFMTLYKK